MPDEPDRTCHRTGAGPRLGEIGENDCAGSYINPLTTWLDSASTGHLAWAWNADFNCSSGPGLIPDYTGTATAYGAAYEAHLASVG